MKIVIVKYNAGNSFSMQLALKRLGIEAIITDNRKEILAADKVIFPGVGEASTAVDYLRERNLDKIIISLKQPFLGICLGLQLLCKHSEENDTDCLGIFKETVKKFPPKNKVPHVGWNNITDTSDPIFKDLEVNPYLYFVHSYFAEIGPDTVAVSNYILPFSAGLRKENFYALQFHPERSGKTGEQILKNFIEL